MRHHLTNISLSSASQFQLLHISLTNKACTYYSSLCFAYILFRADTHLAISAMSHRFVCVPPIDSGSGNPSSFIHLCMVLWDFTRRYPFTSSSVMNMWLCESSLEWDFVICDTTCFCKCKRSWSWSRSFNANWVRLFDFQVRFTLVIFLFARHFAP